MQFLSRFKYIGLAIIVGIIIIISASLAMRANIQNQSQSSVATNPNLETPILQTTITQSSEQPILGHLPYQQANPTDMIIIGSYAQRKNQRFESLELEAGKALMRMIYAARDEKIWIIPVSGFRTIEQQKKLFEEQTKRLGSVAAAAKLSAPPGHSEHHTGYAVDLADGKTPGMDLKFEFANTEAFQWLNRHARKFGFELSFPLNNSQGVSYEPWHWRFIGSEKAKEIFAKVERLR